MACPCPTAGHSRGPTSCCTEMPLGKGQHGTGTGDIPELLDTISLWTLHKGGTGWGHLKSRAVGTGAQPALWDNQHWGTAPGQDPPRFSCPAPGQQQWRPQPQPQLLKLPPCPACPWAPLSSPRANGRSRAPPRAGRTRQGTALTCHGWPQTSTLCQTEGGDGPRLAAIGAPLKFSACSLLPLHPQPFSGIWPWEQLQFGITQGKGRDQGQQSLSPEGHGWHQGGTCRGASPCIRSVPKRPQITLLRGDGGRTMLRPPDPGGDTAQGTPGTHTGTVWHPPKSWVPVFSSSRYITFLRTTQP